jgi:hypothetical protein
MQSSMNTHKEHVGRFEGPANAVQSRKTLEWIVELIADIGELKVCTKRNGAFGSRVSRKLSKELLAFGQSFSLEQCGATMRRDVFL